jgi:hypothetical protein
MDEYIKLLSEISKSTQQLLNQEFHSVESLEIKQAAATLNQSIEPCFSEILESAKKLNLLVQNCLSELDHAEDVWESKSRISNACTAEIWERISEITAYYSKAKILGDRYQDSTLQTYKEDWKKLIIEIKEKHFTDKNKALKKGVGWTDKIIFTNEIKVELIKISKTVDTMILNSLKNLFGEFDQQLIEAIKTDINNFDQRERTGLSNKLHTTLNILETYFSSLNVERFQIKLDAKAYPTIKKWNERFGEVYWNEVSELMTGLEKEQDDGIRSIFEQRVSQLRKALKSALVFYSNFLELQTRFQQETAEQRLAEKAWIDQQRQKLSPIQASLDGILAMDR